jgi:hypothetical protein
MECLKRSRPSTGLLFCLRTAVTTRSLSTKPLAKSAEPGGEGEAEAGDLLVGEAASEAALVDLPVEHDVGQAVVVDRLGRGAAEADAQAVLVDLGEVEDDLAVPVRAGAHDVVHLNDGILGGGVAEEEGGGGPGGVLGLALEALEAEGHERAEAVEGIAIRERAPAV